jgi:hypothetical protein
MVVYIGELDFATDFIGDSIDTTLTTNISSSCALFVDEKNTPASLDANLGIQFGSDHWKVCYLRIAFQID